MPRAVSVFSAAAINLEAVMVELAADGFHVERDAYGYALGRDGRYILVEDGTEAIADMPESITGRAARHLGCRPPFRAVIMFQDNADDVEFTMSHEVARAIAALAPAVWDNHAGESVPLS